MDGPFAAPPDHPWSRVSPRLARMRRTELLVVGTLVVAGVAAGSAPWHRRRRRRVAVAAAGVVLSCSGGSRSGGICASWGYVERSDDLVVTHGAMFKRLTVVPYGRMQLVDVEAGPIERSFGLVSVKLHTAAATTDAKVCGLTPTVAAAAPRPADPAGRGPRQWALTGRPSHAGGARRRDTSGSTR